MAIEAARLASGSIAMNANAGVNPTVLAQIYTNNEPDIKAVIKCLTPKQLANELIAASLLDTLGLPAPRSFLVFADPADSIGGVNYTHSNGLLMYFGSELSSNATLYNFFTMKSPLALNLISNYHDWGRLLAFDEWTANIDRHLNNYLYDGNKLYFFDHDRCLTGPNWTPAGLIASTLYPCHQCIDVIHAIMQPASKARARARSLLLQLAASTIDIKGAVQASFAESIGNSISGDIPAAVAFLNDRVNHIAAFCDQRIN